MEPLTIKTFITSNIQNVWNLWTEPKHIKNWNHASEDWHTTKSENDLREGGRFSARMEAKDGSMGFDFGGTYDEVVQHEKIKFTLDDGRKVKITFRNTSTGIDITETFEPESQNSIEMQRQGWQAILDNFKKYVESN